MKGAEISIGKQAGEKHPNEFMREKEGRQHQSYGTGKELEPKLSSLAKHNQNQLETGETYSVRPRNVNRLAHLTAS